MTALLPPHRRQSLNIHEFLADARLRGAHASRCRDGRGPNGSRTVASPEDLHYLQE